MAAARAERDVTCLGLLGAAVSFVVGPVWALILFRWQRRLLPPRRRRRRRRRAARDREKKRTKKILCPLQVSFIQMMRFSPYWTSANGVERQETSSKRLTTFRFSLLLLLLVFVASLAGAFTIIFFSGALCVCVCVPSFRLGLFRIVFFLSPSTSNTTGRKLKGLSSN